MIKIRYAELPAGLHVRTEAHGRSTIIYLLPGLSPAERRAALLRARRGADLGHGPPLPAASVAIAVMRNRVRHTLRNGALAFRAHPLLLVPPLVIVASATLVYIMMSAVTFTIRSPQASGPFPQPGPVLAAPPGTSTTAPGSPGHRAGGSAGPPPPGPSSPPGGGRHGRHPKPSPPPGSSPSPAPSGSSSVTPTGPPTAGPPGSPPAPLPTGSPTPTPSPSPSCLDIGPLGICLKL
ncbi:MAG TPA: hypothetical protein VGG35_02840 [Streptosporangiaceae bacterium]